MLTHMKVLGETSVLAARGCAIVGIRADLEEEESTGAAAVWGRFLIQSSFQKSFVVFY